MAIRQLVLPFDKPAPIAPDATYRDRLQALLNQDLDFHDQDSWYASHDFHAFPKFPPQLPHKFITALTEPGDIVLDPMSGSDTTALEALLAGRRAMGFEVPHIGVRHLDRNRRMMPAGAKLDLNSQIQQRMHKEYVIGFYKTKLGSRTLCKSS
ncbi:MAG TPA: hypothetical protein ENN99_13160 [Chloroflexi bacterium]|nr:hypothetical protein [Chloroflexota bacterium]